VSLWPAISDEWLQLHNDCVNLDYCVKWTFRLDGLICCFLWQFILSSGGSIFCSILHTCIFCRRMSFVDVGLEPAFLCWLAFNLSFFSFHSFSVTILCLLANVSEWFLIVISLLVCICITWHIMYSVICCSLQTSHKLTETGVIFLHLFSMSLGFVVNVCSFCVILNLHYEAKRLAGRNASKITCFHVEWARKPDWSLFFILPMVLF